MLIMMASTAVPRKSMNATTQTGAWGIRKLRASSPKSRTESLVFRLRNCFSSWTAVDTFESWALTRFSHIPHDVNKIPPSVAYRKLENTWHQPPTNCNPSGRGQFFLISRCQLLSICGKLDSKLADGAGNAADTWIRKDFTSCSNADCLLSENSVELEAFRTSPVAAERRPKSSDSRALSLFSPGGNYCLG